jgi:hypothetical protein
MADSAVYIMTESKNNRAEDYASYFIEAYALRQLHRK